MILKDVFIRSFFHYLDDFHNPLLLNIQVSSWKCWILNIQINIEGYPFLCKNKNNYFFDYQDSLLYLIFNAQYTSCFKN